MTDTADLINRADVELPLQAHEAPPALPDLLGDALESVRRLADSLSADSAAAAQAGRLLGAIERASGPLVLSVLLERQPAAAELAFPRRADALVADAHRRMARSPYQFPAPALVLGRVRAATAAWAPADSIEAANRVMYALARLNLAAHGFEVSVVARRLTSNPPEMVEAALRAFLEEARRGGR